MEFTDTVRLVIENKEQSVYTIAAGDTVYRALEQLSQYGIGAMMVKDGEKIVGILSERDYARKIALRGLDSHHVRVQDIMTDEVVVASPDDTIETCMRLLMENRIRHLPVIENGNLLGVITAGDLMRWIMGRQGETIEHLKHYIEGGYVR